MFLAAYIKAKPVPAPLRLFVHDKFIDAMVQAAKSLKLGITLSPDVAIGTRQFGVSCYPDWIG